jgi:hypothetical protein
MAPLNACRTMSMWLIRTNSNSLTSTKFVTIEYKDMVIKLEIITSDDDKMEKFFRDYKETLKETFQQKEILITAQEVKTL